MSLSGTASKNQSRRSSRRHRAKDLEQEVELIMSQEDDSDMEMEKSKENDLPTTPKSHKQIDYQHRSPSVGTNDTLAQTPRRSTRKSIKPVQEYEDIVSRKRQLRSASKIEAENIQDADEEPQAKWTPAKVGRVSQKRSRKSRKSTKNQNKSKIISSSEAEDNEYEKGSLKTNTSEESLQIQDSVDTVESEAVAEKNMDILINKITENKAKYTNENIGSELRKENSKTAERKPTPFRPKATVPNNEEEEDCEEGAHSITIEVSKMEPKEIVLRSIRKRSLSVCIGNTEAENRRKNVTFYSPANQTTILEDLDTRIVQSVKKNYGAKTGGNVSCKLK
ncbi:uncharacterized protein LOC118738257 [Rhagoletis pomonella]|uniref:uncharacterized protein LOC118738257 n=1 Tax=Rhagoletis pomonella TaxID=28610 RepID=UPI00178201A4|nr:uncharacterized protein LOC118738257 [Rhagoletis pomonella]